MILYSCGKGGHLSITYRMSKSILKAFSIFLQKVYGSFLKKIVFYAENLGKVYFIPIRFDP